MVSGGDRVALLTGLLTSHVFAVLTSPCCADVTRLAVLTSPCCADVTLVAPVRFTGATDRVRPCELLAELLSGVIEFNLEEVGRPP